MKDPTYVFFVVKQFFLTFMRTGGEGERGGYPKNDMMTRGKGGGLDTP